MSIQHAYLHGFASSPQSVKGLALAQSYGRSQGEGKKLLLPDLAQPSFGEMSLSASLEVLDQMHQEHSDSSGEEVRWRLIASSLGGYLAARWAELHPERVDRLLLLCPAFGITTGWGEILGAEFMNKWKETGFQDFENSQGVMTPVSYALIRDMKQHPAIPNFRCPTRIIHGIEDEVVTIESSRKYLEEHRSVQDLRLEEVHDEHRLSSSFETIEATAKDFLWDERRVFYWDFFGADAKQTAEHFQIHLRDFLARENIPGSNDDHESLQAGHYAIRLKVPSEYEETILRALRPRRAL